jgi:hypothetical protein
MFKQSSKHTCPHHDQYECPDTLILELKDGTYGLSIKDGGSSFVSIKWCPFCGQKLKDKNSGPFGSHYSDTLEDIPF